MSLSKYLNQRFRASRISIRARLTLLAAIAIFAFLGLAIAESLAVKTILARVESEDVARRVHRAQRFFEQRASNKANLISEFSFWDDTWNMVDDPGSAVSQTHISENFRDWLPQRYGDRLIEIWSRERVPVWQWADSQYTDASGLFDHQVLFNRLMVDRLAGGYIGNHQRLMLLGSALILREGDQTLSGPSNGFVVVAEPIDTASLAQYEDELLEHLSLRPLPPAWPLDSVGIELRSGGDSIGIQFPLIGFDGRPLVLISMQRSRAFTSQLSRSTSWLILGTMLVGIGVLALLWRAGNRLVVRPLGAIEEALDTMQQQGGLARIETTPPTREWSLFVNAFNGTVEALHSSEKRYQVLFNHAADAHFLLDAKTQTILEANPAAELMSGQSRAEMIGRPFSNVLRLDSSGTSGGTFRLRRPDGTDLVVGVATADLEIGGVPRQLASLRDLTRNEALAAQLRQSQKMEAIGSLAGGIAHDFNNLLGTVLIAATSLKDDVLENQSALESITAIESASRRAAELTRRLLSFARREQQSTVPVALNDLVRNVVRLCERTFDRAIRIEAEYRDSLPSVMGDPGQLEQALLNLCINARDAMPDGGLLSIATARRRVSATEAATLRDVAPGEYVTVRVADTGFGLTRLAEQHLFEPFFTTKGPGKGTGLGLPMVYGLVRAHGGGIQVKNQPGKGAEFEIYLPITDQPVSDPAPAIVASPPRGSERILVIDDEAALRTTVTRALTRLGYQVDNAKNGAEGARMFNQTGQRYDLVILDMIMPEMGGTEAFRVIRDTQPDIRILISSGYAPDSEKSELISSANVGFLQKPFGTMDLALAVRELLDRVSSGPGESPVHPS